VVSGRLFGMATAAQQVEGGIEGSDWELFTRDPAISRRVGALLNIGVREVAPPLQPPGEAVRHGNLEVLEMDLDRARLLGANAYRFSLEWARLEPEPGHWNQDVLVRYYLKVIEALRARGMEPVVTLQHLSLPAWVLTPPSRTRWLGPLPFASGRDRGFRGSLRGWESSETVDAFAAFVARVAPALRDAGVHWWIPLNEPTGSVVGLGYIGGIWPPGFTVDGVRAKAAHLNLLRAHVRAHDIIKSCDPDAMVGVAHALTPFRSLGRPGLLKGRDADATAQADYFFNLHFLDSVVSGRVDLAIDRRRPRWVPARTFFGSDEPEWRPRLDFIGVNYYRPLTIRWHPLIALRAPIAGGLLTNVPVPVAADNGTKVEPSGLAEVVREVHRRYGLPVLITENGVAEGRDRIRAPHLVGHLEALREAEASGVRVLGYLYWSLLDNWEWDSGYGKENRHGLLSVDFDAAGQPRALTEAALAFRHLGLGGSLEEARSLYGTIAGDGSRVELPRRSPGALWRASSAPGGMLVYTTRLDDRSHGLVFDPAGGRWRELGAAEWPDLAPGLQRDWRDGVWVPEGGGAPFHALRLSALGRWEVAGHARDRWRGRTHDGTTWRTCDCHVEGDQLDLAIDPPVQLRFSGCRLSAQGQDWTLARLADAGSWPG
jgi:beta-glucosidase